MSQTVEEKLKALKLALENLENKQTYHSKVGDEQIDDDIKQLKIELKQMLCDKDINFPISGWAVDYNLRKQLENLKCIDAHKKSKQYFTVTTFNKIKELEADNKIVIDRLMKEYNDEINKVKDEIKKLSESIPEYTTEIVDDPLTQYQTMTKRKNWLRNEITKIVNETDADGKMKYPWGTMRPMIVQKRLDELSEEEDNIYHKLRLLEHGELKIQKEVEIDGKKYKIGKYYRCSRRIWVMIVNETNMYYKFQELSSSVFSSTFGSSEMKYELPTTIIGDKLIKMSKNKIDPVYIYETDIYTSYDN
jgi:hypothetical protein